MPSEKIKVNYKITKEAKEFLNKLKSKLGVSHTAIVEISIREKAEKENITLE